MKSKSKKKGMRYPALNDLISRANNKYELVIATAKRAREIIDGSDPLTIVSINNPISIATEEIAEDKVRLDNPVLNEKRRAQLEGTAKQDQQSYAVDYSDLTDGNLFSEESDSINIADTEFYSTLMDMPSESADEETVPEERIENALETETEEADISDLELTPMPATEENADLAFEADMEAEAEASSDETENKPETETEFLEETSQITEDENGN